MTVDFGHVVTAMVTPFLDNGDVNYDEAITLAGFLRDTGTDTILLAGTTGESPTLTHQEEFDLFQKVKAALGKQTHVMAGAGSNCTQTAIEATQKACDAGVDSVLQVVPYYNKPSQEGMFRHFEAVAKHSSLPIMLYNIPGRTAVNMEVETIKRCANLKNIIGIKEAGGSISVVKELCEVLPGHVAVYSGDDGLTFECLQVGAKGVVSVAAHCVGNKIHQMVSSFHNNDTQTAENIHNELAPLWEALFITTNPTPVKAALRMMGKPVGPCRLPLIDVTAEEHKTLESVLKQLDLL